MSSLNPTASGPLIVTLQMILQCTRLRAIPRSKLHCISHGQKFLSNELRTAVSVDEGNITFDKGNALGGIFGNGEHLNLTGDYTWLANKRVAKGGFRPLRTGNKRMFSAPWRT